ncbi:hypothetical protein EXN66_Car021554 [Channa argus]|uniref:Uncharacterized protein n=1 Tax=Channa argus TaxID=215402 RepID=A0A6G1QU91_CHAAH|nr:hypothetical protein EXN66_Car021554 [Channa argus]
MSSKECQVELVGLVLLSLTLLISMCLNVVFCFRRRDTLCRDTYDCCYSHNIKGEGLSQGEGQYFHDLNHHENQENPHNHEQQENPIYGNITIDRRVSSEICYEMMTKQQTRGPMKPSHRDLNYASLDLKVAKKRRKHHYQQSQAQGNNNCQDQLPAHSTISIHDFLEVDEDMDAHLPPRDTSTMVSHSSIYLNSQQIAQEAEEMERGWEGIRRQESGGSIEWEARQESEEREDTQSDGNRTACAQLLDDIHSGTDNFSSFNHDSDHQD